MNEWARGICNKPKIKCSECNNKNYAALDFAAIDKHLRGKDVFGIYPMLLDETCYLLAIDFDDEGWEKDISVLRDICAEKNIPFAVERSRSGNGAHVWFFNSVFIDENLRPYEDQWSFLSSIRKLSESEIDLYICNYAVAVNWVI
ncbi:MAG: putative helicase [Firmicutes bacterium]|nr:putative helicase [Bacillota bacterium]